MAFRRSNFILGRGIDSIPSLDVPYKAFVGDTFAPVEHFYGSSEDSKTAVGASGYFDSILVSDPTPSSFVYPLVQIGDVIRIKASDGIGLLEITALSPSITTVPTSAGVVFDNNNMFTGAFTGAVVLRYTKAGKVGTVSFPTVSQTAGSSNIISVDFGVPAEYRPAELHTWPILVVNSGTQNIGLFELSTAGIATWTANDQGDNFGTGAPSTINAASFSYIIA